MTKYHDNGYNFFMRRINHPHAFNKEDRGVEDERNIEESFFGLVYLDATGIDSYGKPSVYTERFVESAFDSVYTDNRFGFSPTEIILRLGFICKVDASNDAKLGIEKVNTLYHRFVEYISGCNLFYRDTLRNRIVEMFLNNTIEISKDILRGRAYKEVSFKFTNIYGRSFPLPYKVENNAPYTNAVISPYSMNKGGLLELLSTSEPKGSL